ncbi:MAG: glutamate synthase subunit beta [Candidatus Omnitrophota bacterium]
MKDVKAFLKIKREVSPYRPACERIEDYKEVIVRRSDKKSQEQAHRCMDCGVPFCHWGCQVANIIPEWNTLMFLGQWKKAFELLDTTNDLPEITGRVCPARCEYACVLGINDDAVTIRDNELAIIEHAFKKGFIKPRSPKRRTGKSVAVVGSGPAGLSCAATLNRSGHNVVVFEKHDALGGIMRYGIPDFKLEKWIIERRIALWKKEGIKFKTGVNVGIDYKPSEIKKDFDAICLAVGSRKPRDLKIEGRDLKGIHFAMDYLIQANKRVSGDRIPKDMLIDAKDKKVVVIGGGDTGADCVGVAHRQKASCIIQIEVLPKPPECRTDDYPWPEHPLLLKSSSSHEEGAERHWQVLTKGLIGESGKVKKLVCVNVEFTKNGKDACPVMKEIPGSEFEIEADLVILAIGFLHPEHIGLLDKLGLAYDSRGNVKTGDYHMSSKKGIFAAGDMRRGQSLIVWAIQEGRSAASSIDEYLTRPPNTAHPTYRPQDRTSRK